MASVLPIVAAALADPACVHDREGALALEKAFKAFIGVAVGEQLGEDALHVALGDGVRRIVPVRIGEDDVVGGSDIGLLNGNVGGRFAKAVLGVEEGFNGENRVEADLVEVADFDFHAGLHEVVSAVLTRSHSTDSWRGSPTTNSTFFMSLLVKPLGLTSWRKAF